MTELEHEILARLTVDEHRKIWASPPDVTNQEAMEAMEAMAEPVAAMDVTERPARLMVPAEWREWERAIAQASSVSEWKDSCILNADAHIRALLVENLQLHQDYEHLRTEIEPLRQHYLVLKHDTAEYIKEKERRENEAILARLGRVKRAWWRRWFGR